MKKKMALGITAVSVMAAMAAGNVQAHAATGNAFITLTSSSPPAQGGRTLTLDNASGSPLTSLDLSNGSNGFEAIVSDSNYSDTGFTVNATMSNLYGYASGTYNCSEKVPSSDVSLNSPANLLEANGVTGSGIPTITLSGSLGTVLGTTLDALVSSVGGTTTITNMATSTGDQSFTEAQLAGGKTGELIGSTLATANTDLPIALTSAAGTAFTDPAADPSGASCGTTGTSPTAVTVENGTATSAVPGDVAGVVNGLGSPTTAATLASQGWISASAVMTSVAGALNLPLGDISALQPAILAALTPTVTGVGSVEVSGNYEATPVMSVNASSVPGGAYQGVLTVTLADS